MATYYVAESGTAANKSAATSGTYPGGCMSLTTHNSETFSAGDTIWVLSDGGVIRTQLTIPSSGSSGDPIEYQFDADAQLNGSTVITGWSVYSGSVYRATASDPEGVFCDGERGEEQTSIGNCTSERDWYYTGGYLYLYSGDGDPDTVYTSPGVEGVYRRCLYCSKNYISFYGNGVDIRHGTDYMVWVRTDGEPTDPMTGIIFDNFVAHHTRDGANAIGFWDISNLLVKRCHVHHAGWNAIQLSATDPGSKPEMSNHVFEYNYLHDCNHGGFDFHTWYEDVRTITGIVCRYNRLSVLATPDSYYNDTSIYFLNAASPGDKIKNCDCYGNIVIRGKQNGIGYDIYGSATPMSGMKCYNNTIAYCGQGGYGPAIWAKTTGGLFKNNIFYENEQNEDDPAEICVQDSGYSANVVDYNCVYHSTNTQLYQEDSTLYTHSGYQSFGQQTHGINADPQFTDPANDDFTLQSDSPCVNAGADLGEPYNIMLMPSSTWPDGVVTGDQDDY